MKNYSEMSDFEISKAVGNHIRVEWANLDKNYNQLSIWVGGRDGLFVFDPCNNPSDAWPIILENEVALNPRCANGEWKAQVHLGKHDIFDEYASCWDKNPLRAAMIVYLMMKDSEKC